METSTIISYIDENLTGIDHRNHGLDRKFGLGRKTLDWRMREATGRTLVQYIKQEKLKLAHKIFHENSTLTVLEVMIRVGYNIDSVRGFSEAYKKQFGHSPKNSPILNASDGFLDWERQFFSNKQLLNQIVLRVAFLCEGFELVDNSIHRRAYECPVENTPVQGHWIQILSKLHFFVFYDAFSDSLSVNFSAEACVGYDRGLMFSNITQYLSLFRNVSEHHKDDAELQVYKAIEGWDDIVKSYFDFFGFYGVEIKEEVKKLTLNSSAPFITLTQPLFEKLKSDMTQDLDDFIKSHYGVTLEKLIHFCKDLANTRVADLGFLSFYIDAFFSVRDKLRSIDFIMTVIENPYFDWDVEEFKFERYKSILTKLSLSRDKDRLVSFMSQLKARFDAIDEKFEDVFDDEELENQTEISINELYQEVFEAKS